MNNLLNALERTADNFRLIIQASGFKLNRIYPTRGSTSSMSSPLRLRSVSSY